MIPAFIIECSGTAEPAFGNGRYIGPASIRAHTPKGRAPGHRSFIGTPSAPRPVDNQAEAIRLRDEERARRALWLDCERRPIAMDRGEG